MIGRFAACTLPKPGPTRWLVWEGRVGRFRSKEISHHYEAEKLAQSDSPHSIVIRARHDGLAIRADGHTIHTVFMPFQRALYFA